MGKKLGAGSSWLSGVRRAFGSPSSKDHHSNYCPSRTGSGHDQHQYHDEDNKKREKRRWAVLRRGGSRSNNNIIQQCESCRGSLGGEQRHAIAVATTAAAEAAAKAAVEFIRLTSTPPPPSTSLSLLHYAAIVIQTAFRGYLARRALQALKGIVKLQALVRGHNVRKQTKMTFQCMQALLRVQSRVRDQRSRASHESTRKSMFAESTNLWESTYMRDIRERKSNQSRAGSWIPDDWEDCPQTLEELDARQQARKEKTLAYAFSQQIWDTSKDPSVGNEKGLQEAGDWLDRWIATKQSESHKRYSSDRRETVKTLEIDTSMPYCYSSPIVSRSHCQTTPQHRGLAPVTPSPAKMKPLQGCSASPRGQREGRRSYSTASTPSLASARCSRNGLTRCSNDTPADSVMPNYMAATESAKARVRSQSVTRQRPSTPERERVGSVKKRLSYPVHDIYRNFGIGCNSFNEKLKSPSFKSVQAGRMRIEQGSNLSSCCADSVGGEISPCSTTDGRGWLR